MALAMSATTIIVALTPANTAGSVADWRESSGCSHRAASTASATPAAAPPTANRTLRETMG